MAEGPSHQQQQHLLLHHHQPPPPQRSRFGGGGLRSIPGEIVEVQGGHIVRSTGRKDRHSKVCTAKGPRDRRVRLSAHTAIQFYDVQDRLGYDRPSKAVDWLIKNAKASIDELAELPAWLPTATVNPPAPHSNRLDSRDASHGGEATDEQMHVSEQGRGSSSHYEFGGGGGGGGSSSFLPPSLDSDAIADTIKSFFPVAAAGSNSSVSAAAPSSSSPFGFQNYPPDLLSRTSSQNQDLRLSLQSFQDPIYHHPSAAAAQHQHHHHHQHHTETTNAAGLHGLFSGFDASAMAPWNVQESSGGGDGGSGNVVGGGGYVFNVPLQLQNQQAVAMLPGLGHGQSQFFTQRGPLQSSNPPFVRAWADPMAAAADHHPMHSVIHPSIGFVSGSGFSGFRIPARIQGEEEQQHDGISDKPSSASSGSHH